MPETQPSTDVPARGGSRKRARSDAQERESSKRHAPESSVLPQRGAGRPLVGDIVQVEGRNAVVYRDGWAQQLAGSRLYDLQQHAVSLTQPRAALRCAKLRLLCGVEVSEGQLVVLPRVAARLLTDPVSAVARFSVLGEATARVVAVAGLVTACTTVGVVLQPLDVATAQLLRSELYVSARHMTHCTVLPGDAHRRAVEEAALCYARAGQAMAIRRGSAVSVVGDDGSERFCAVMDVARDPAACPLDAQAALSDGTVATLWACQPSRRAHAARGLEDENAHPVGVACGGGEPLRVVGWADARHIVCAGVQHGVYVARRHNVAELGKQTRLRDAALVPLDKTPLQPLSPLFAASVLQALADGVDPDHITLQKGYIVAGRHVYTPRDVASAHEVLVGMRGFVRSLRPAA